MSDAHNPERVRALQGCAELYRLAASHLTSIPPNYEEAARAISTSINTGQEIWKAVMMDDVMSGGFQERLFTEMTKDKK